MKHNLIENCTHPVPENPYGIFAMHCLDNEPIGAEDLKAIINGPIAAIEPSCEEERLKTASYQSTPNS